LARQAAISGAQGLLEEAVSNKNNEQIENCQELLRKALHVNIGSNDALPPIATQIARTGNPCKEAECPLSNPEVPGCFWRNICQSEETAQILSQAQEALKGIKAATAEADARKSRGYKVAF
jgi:hypothetical protein